MWGKIKRGSTFCKYCGTKQYSVIKKSLHRIYKGVRRSERFIIKHVAVIVVVLLMVIIGLQILSIANRESSSTTRSSPRIFKSSPRGFSAYTYQQYIREEQDFISEIELYERPATYEKQGSLLWSAHRGGNMICKCVRKNHNNYDRLLPRLYTIYISNDENNKY